MTLEFKGILPVPHPADHTAKEGAVLPHGKYGIFDLFVYDPEIAGIFRNIDARKGVECPVKSKSGKLLESALALPGLALSVYHIIAFAPFFKHFRQKLGRILKVCVDYRYGLSASHFKACSHSHLVPEISGKINYLYFIVIADARQKHVVSPVARAVVYKNQFIIALKRQKCAFQALIGLCYDLFFIIHGYNNRKQRHVDLNFRWNLPQI